MSKTSLLHKSDDPKICNHPMGVTSMKSPASKLRYCGRPKATCPYHQQPAD